MLSSIRSAPVSPMKVLSNKEICRVKYTPLGHNVLPSATSPMCHRARAWAKSQGVQSPSFGHPSRNCPMFSTVGAGGHMGLVDTLAVDLHADMRCFVSSLVAGVPPSVNGMTSSHHVMSSSPKLSLQASSHIIVCHLGSRRAFTGELFIMICLLVSWKGLSPSESSF